MCYCTMCTSLRGKKKKKKKEGYKVTTHVQLREGPLGTTSVELIHVLLCAWEGPLGTSTQKKKKKKTSVEHLSLFMCCCACAVCTNLKRKNNNK
jgi:hypothetical protein